MQANYVQRLRLTFAKDGPARYVGHLDLARTFERAMNRARLPVSYTQGFNRRPRLAFASPLPLGYTSEYELADIWLSELMDAQRMAAELMRRMAPGITIRDVAEVPLREPSLQSQTVSAHYTAAPFDSLAASRLARRVATLLAQTSLLRERRKRKGKSYDLRPLILALNVDEYKGGKAFLNMELMLRSGKSGRPDEVLAALDLDPLAAHIHRTSIILADEDQA